MSDAILNDEQKENLWEGLLKKFQDTLPALKTLEDVFKQAIDLMADLPHFHWTGIYWLSDKNTLELFDYYKGLPTDHTRIPVGQGVCGTAVAENQDIIVDDVRGLDNYLACSIGTRAEIVVLIRNPTNGDVLGQIDVDSDVVGAFNEVDRRYMELVAHKIAAVAQKN